MNHIAEKELASKSTKRKRYFLMNSLKQKKKRSRLSEAPLLYLSEVYKNPHN